MIYIASKIMFNIALFDSSLATINGFGRLERDNDQKCCLDNNLKFSISVAP